MAEDDEEKAEGLLENDAISPEEEGFIRGADDSDVEEESDDDDSEEELEEE